MQQDAGPKPALPSSSLHPQAGLTFLVCEVGVCEEGDSEGLMT